MQDPTDTLERTQVPELDYEIISPPSTREKWIMRTLILLGLISVGIFCYWFIDVKHIGYKPLYYLLAFALSYKLLRMLHEWFHYSAMSAPEKPELTRDYTVDMITTFCPGEPYEMILETLEAMVNVRYPHTTYLCDEGNDPFLKQKCAELGVVHVTRTEKINAKAGNVNNCLRNHATGEIAIVLDPDHVPSRDFIDRVLPYFEDEKIGYVQCVQAYYNRNESFIAKGAAQQTYHFYGPMMMSMNSFGTVQAIGANCSFRRAALDSIGGHAAGLSEDMHTAMQMHAKGWESVYVPESLTRGLVPATLSSYFKQQLKWSRGSFELLVATFPKLWKNFSLSQFLHYLTIPLYFFSGVIALIDIAVPILSLFLARSPWTVEMGELLQAALPMLLMLVLIRQFAQRWVLEEHERGFHFLGGALWFATWWISLTGFIYTIFRVKVPYIPTPKGDELINEFKLSLPNIIVILLSIAAIAYGLSVDWSPYSFIMAGYAAVNVFFLSFIVIISQQKALKRVYDWFYGGPLTTFRQAWYIFRHKLVYNPMRNGYVVLSLIAGVTLFSATMIKPANHLDLAKTANAVGDKHNEGFYTGWKVQPGMDSGKLTTLGEAGLSIASADVTGIDANSMVSAIQQAGRSGDPEAIMLNWAPAMDWAEIAAGKADTALQLVATALQQSHQQIYLSIATPADSSAEGLADFQAGYRTLVSQFKNWGVYNVSWSWAIQDPSRDLAAYPGAEYVDMVSVDVNAWRDSSGNWKSFESTYESLQPKIYQHPVFLTGWTRGDHPERSGAWMNDALAVISREYDEVRGVILGELPIEQDDNFSWERLMGLNAEFAPARYASTPQTHVTDWVKQVAGGQVGAGAQERPYAIPVSDQLVEGPTSNEARRGKFFRKSSTGYDFLLNDEPFYIKGVAYNPSSDWRDGHTPLTRRKLIVDFREIYHMGGNTIRRYTPSIYDYNLLNTADDFGINVMYGFWFDPSIDYHTDSAAVVDYVEEVVELVTEHQGHSSIIAWSLGNETWNRISYHFHPTYAFKVRKAYLTMVNEIARRIHEIDPDRPVFSAFADGNGLPGALEASKAYAPELDFLSVNSAYEAHISRLDSLMQDHIKDAPYLVSEFGPEGYWVNDLSKWDENMFLEEPSDYQKAIQYARNWSKHIEPYRGHNIGGMAFSWQDRMEGTRTWMGITDYEGYRKPAFYALQRAFTFDSKAIPLEDLYLVPPQNIAGKRPYLPFRVVTPDHELKGTSIEAFVCREGFREEVGQVSYHKDYHFANVQMPLDTGVYRIYVSIRDENRNTVTASRAFRVTPDMVED
ncbi:glycosyltransferase [Pontibacter sp. G13]|uniref:glycosyltransferase n=1 Tax=Pontibacter sp. G13 TaxID=3074898 RepID=UPI00288C2AC2|nr:glycosyltransferase [Pontibacter sp. G13]WNJ19761.1 glycosyltransferase [Pontibacter sp. G13]